MALDFCCQMATVLTKPHARMYYSDLGKRRINLEGRPERVGSSHFMVVRLSFGYQVMTKTITVPKSSLNGAVVRAVLCCVYSTLNHRVCQAFRGEDEVDRRLAVPRTSSAVPCLGASFEQATECQFFHNVDDRICLALPAQGHILSSPELIMAVEVSHDGAKPYYTISEQPPDISIPMLSQYSIFSNNTCDHVSLLYGPR